MLLSFIPSKTCFSVQLRNYSEFRDVFGKSIILIFRFYHIGIVTQKSLINTPEVTGVKQETLPERQEPEQEPASDPVLRSEYLGNFFNVYLE